MSMILCLPSAKAEMAASVTDVDRHSIYLNRDSVEDDPRFRQVIPYVLVTSNRKVLSYQRKGSESRLHAYRSIGIGGHVEAPENVEYGMIRELREEVGMVPDLNRIRWHGFIRLNENMVDRVHMGVVYSYEIADDDVLKFSDEIVDPQWVDDVDDSYEPWSIEAWKLMGSW